MSAAPAITTGTEFSDQAAARPAQLFWGLPLVLCGLWLAVHVVLLAEDMQRERVVFLKADRPHGKGWPRDMIWDGGDLPHRMQWLRYRTFLFQYWLIGLDVLGIVVCLSSSKLRRTIVLWGVYLAFWCTYAFGIYHASRLMHWGHSDRFALVAMSFIMTPWVLMGIAILYDFYIQRQSNRPFVSSPPGG